MLPCFLQRGVALQVAKLRMLAIKSLGTPYELNVFVTFHQVYRVYLEIFNGFFLAA